MISDLFTKTVTVRRLALVDGETVKKEYATHLAGVPCMIQPLEASISGSIPGGFGKDFLMFAGLVDIQEGDRVLDGAKEYRVVGVERFEFGTREDHVEASIRIFDGA